MKKSVQWTVFPPNKYGAMGTDQLKALHAFNISDSLFPGFSVGRDRGSYRQHSARQDRTTFHGDSHIFKFVRMISRD